MITMITITAKKMTITKTIMVKKKKKKNFFVCYEKSYMMLFVLLLSLLLLLLGGGNTTPAGGRGGENGSGIILGVVVVVEGMVELNHAMFKASNLEEFREAFVYGGFELYDHPQQQQQKKQPGFKTVTTKKRKKPRRMLQQQQQQQRQRDRQPTVNSGESSSPIYADSFPTGTAGFYHGVASGDPLKDSVILWTRYTPLPQSSNDDVVLELRVAELPTTAPTVDGGDDNVLEVESLLDPNENTDLRRTKIIVNNATDFVAKIDVTGLQEGTDYVFAFSDGEVVSTIGRTKTAPGLDTDVESMVYAVFSCSHFANGYFHAYDIASTIQDLDFWIHVGDYVYEYGLFSTYASDAPDERKSKILPLWEQISLQDHRNRMATYHLDEGLRNLRARAPLIACWDDHETTNNPYGDGTVENTGAENHQEVCPVNSTSPDEEKNAAKCDRDEGTVMQRFNDAAQSYLEWMPIRRYEGTMGIVNIGSIHQVISWGDMATIVTFDTRLTARSAEPTINSTTWDAFIPFAATNSNVSQYSTVLLEDLEKIAGPVHQVLESDEFTMIGNDAIDFLQSSFDESSKAGQPWQIWATATALGRAVKGDYSRIADFVDDPDLAPAVEVIADAIYSSNASAFLRALTAQSITSTPWNRDDFSGFAHEQRKILEVFKSVATNPIVLAGDLHDGYAWQLFEGGAVNGTPCAVNLVCPGVTSPGWGPFISPAFGPVADVIGIDNMYNALERADEEANPGLVYFNHQYKGFFAVKATKTRHVAEFFVIDPQVILSNYSTAREASGGKIVADFKCDVQVTTTAGVPGSLDRSETCGVIQFETDERSLYDKIRFPLFPNQQGDIDDEVQSILQNCGYDQCLFDFSSSTSSSSSSSSSSSTWSGCGVSTMVNAAALLVLLYFSIVLSVG